MMLGLTAQLTVVSARLEETELRSNSFSSAVTVTHQCRCSTRLAVAGWKREDEGGDVVKRRL